MKKNKKGPRARIHFRIPINEKQYINFSWPNLHEKPNKFGKSAIYSTTLQYFSFRLKLCVDLPVKTSENVVTALQFGVLERKFSI